jgi:capsular polysaccharide biosynthesis protein
MTSRDRTPFGRAPGEQPDDPGTVISAPVSLSFLKTALRRRRWVWISTAVVGLLLGASLRVVEPPSYKAVADVYLTELSSADPRIALPNEVAMAQTEPVAAQAVKDQHWDVPPYALLGSYKASVLGGQIVRITASAKYSVAAVAIAKAVSQAFLEFRENNLTQANNTTVTGLQAQIDQLQKDMAAAGPNPTQTQISDQAEVLQLQTEIQTDNQQVASQVKNSKIIDPAAQLPSKKKKVVIRDGVAGLIGGLALGMALVIGQAVLSDRLRRRDEIAEALGAPVELSVGGYRRPLLMRKHRLAMRVTHPSPEMKMVARRLSSHLEQAPGAALAVVSVECSEPAALAVASVARSLAEEGGRVTVVDLAEGRPLQSLFKLPELDPAGPGDINFHSASEPKKSLLLRAEEWRLTHLGRDHGTLRRSSPRRRTTPAATTSRPVVSPTSIRDPLGSWAAWDMRHESVSKWSRDGSGQYRAWGSFRPPDPQPGDDAWEIPKIHELMEPTPAPIEEPLEADAQTAFQDEWGDEDYADQDEEGGTDQPGPADTAGALSRIHPSPVPLVAKRGSVTVVTGPDDPTQIGVHRSNNGVDAVLVLATVNPAFGANHIASWATESVVMISAGAASGARLSATAQMLENGGVKVDSAILVGADRHDETAGIAGQEQATGADHDRSWMQKRAWGSRG